MLDTVGILWTTNAHRLARPQNTKYLETLRTKISKNYQQFFRYFKGSDTSYKNFVTALCNWNRADSLLELLSEWLEEGFRSGLSGHHKEKRRSRRQVRFCETVQPKPLVALHILRHVLEHPLNRVSVLAATARAGAGHHTGHGQGQGRCGGRGEGCLFL
ncbi:Condensin-2 complex subunit G2 [Chionoecetes opilio]|uniref:Condensin-2 complex subunit G2 n=1 Tax=Chionoecetes opilio TaxID=41210 RepID=A0A8J4XNF9_CHIOP|nr:Condensin-2 complex subunit G2 [Chionoecetes opilio]